MSGAAGDISLIESYTRALGLWLAGHGLRILIIVGGALLITRLLYVLIGRIHRLADDGDPTYESEREKRANTLVFVLRQVTWIGILGIATMMVLREIGVDIAPIIAGAGILGLAVGFGAQSLVKDVISGFFILLENQFGVGDVVEGAGVSGSVEAMGLRYTRLRDLQGRVHFIPNGEFKVVSNLTRGWSRAVVDIGVAYKEDVEHVMAVMHEVADGMKEEPAFSPFMLEPMEILGVDSFGDSAVNIRLVFRTIAGKHWPVAREFRRRLKRRFDAEGIQIPFPQRVVHMVTEPAGSPAAKGEPAAAAPAPGRTSVAGPAATMPAGPGDDQPHP